MIPTRWNSAAAAPLTASQIALGSLKAGEFLTGLLGGRHASRAAMLDRQANRELLTGITEALDGMTEGISEIIEHISELPTIIQNLLIQHRNENLRASTRANYSEFLTRKRDFLEPNTDIGYDPNTVSAYIVSLQTWLSNIRLQAGILEATPHHNRTELPLLMGLCLRAEIDISNELEGLDIDAYSPNTLDRYAQYFREIIPVFEDEIRSLEESFASADTMDNTYIRLALEHLGEEKLYGYHSFPENILDAWRFSTPNHYNIDVIIEPIIAKQVPLTAYAHTTSLTYGSTRPCHIIQPYNRNIPMRGRQIHALLTVDCESSLTLITKGHSYTDGGEIYEVTGPRFGSPVFQTEDNEGTHNLLVNEYRGTEGNRNRIAYELSSYRSALDSVKLALQLSTESALAIRQISPVSMFSE